MALQGTAKSECASEVRLANEARKIIMGTIRQVLHSEGWVGFVHAATLAINDLKGEWNSDPTRNAGIAADLGELAKMIKSSTHHTVCAAQQAERLISHA